jgi:hypothetical protein
VAWLPEKQLGWDRAVEGYNPGKNGVNTLPVKNQNRATIILIAALGLLVTTALQTPSSSAAFLAFNFIYWSAVALGFIYAETKVPVEFTNRLLIGFLLRILIIGLWEIYPPQKTIVSWNSYEATGVVFEDEAFYLQSANQLLDLGINAGGPLADQYVRAVMVFALLLKATGSSLFGVRMVTAAISTVVSALLYACIAEASGRTVRKNVQRVCAYLPELIVWSALLMKETYVLLGVSLFVFGSLQLVTKHIGARSILNVIIGLLICLWFRPEMVIVLSWILGGTIAYRESDNHRLAYKLGLIGLLVPAVLLLLVDQEVLTLLPLLGGTAEELQLARQKMMATGALADIRLPFMETLGSLQDGPLQRISFVLLLSISPIVTSISSLIPLRTVPSWESVAVASYAASWWVILPYLVIGVGIGIRKRARARLYLVGSLALWFIVSSQMRGGIGYDSVRYREALLPVQLILAADGLYHLKDVLLRSSGAKVLVNIYWFIVAMLLFLKATGFIGG